MNVTLFVDASYYERTNAAAWGMYAISHIDRLIFSSRFKTPITDSTQAEFAGVANALGVTLAHPLAAGARVILLQCDCQSVLNFIEARESRRYPHIMAHILGLLDKYGVELQLRHVRGHSGTDAPRTYCQDQCDRYARQIAQAMHVERGGRPSKWASRRPRRNLHPRR